MALSPSDIREIQAMIDRADSESMRRVKNIVPEIFARLTDSDRRSDNSDRIALFDNYSIFNATSLGKLLPRGTLFITDVGTTPTRSIALVYSDGQKHVNLAAVVI